MAPTTTRQWSLPTRENFDSLKWEEKAPIAPLGDKDVLVKIQAVSLNYRDLIIASGNYPLPVKDNVIPGSDGAGIVEAVGSRVTRFKPGDKVATLFSQGLFGGIPTAGDLATGLGGPFDGVLRDYAALDEQGLVHMPSNLSFAEASALPCAAVTAWNALYGLEGRTLKPGQTVLTQGTGGVSIFALQFAKAAGARVIATTSSEEKAKLLKQYGADHVINYKEHANWGEKAKELTPGGQGCEHVIEVGGPTSMAQSLKAIKVEGVISIIGFLGGFAGDQPSFVEALINVCTVRGLMVGSRKQFEEMNSAIEANNIHPIVDKAEFELAQLKEAYQYMWDQKHFGKLVVKIGQ